MKRILFILIAAAAVFASCNDYETYGDKKEKERNAIAKFISDSSIVVISEDQFNRQGQTTDLARNEYVKFDKNGVYMQIVRQGCGTKLQDGEKTRLICRFSEYNLLEDTITLCNNNNELYYYGKSVVKMPDIMQISRTGSSFTASFLSGIMYSVYKSAAVPSGWLVPLSYVNVGRPQSADEEYSMVRLIVPHSQGHADASGNVIPYFYEITFQRES
ncbi:protein of unknown function [Prevotella aff. ruminicola Tc2-24]|uniref:DUF4827 domain-containing protein n=1 Tax=Prevotella aff. ruminicola Tc2-24 TaxID=81582 RepID=A0A1I0MQ31_9BACT|nr:DUF4827 domain-containing protein [Prevotella aff. ruminicola Tc2-24]SEV90280.1 protein of unknown function [Prevotella aff. ruminicola Tc2-24]